MAALQPFSLRHRGPLVVSRVLGDCIQDRVGQDVRLPEGLQEPARLQLLLRRELPGSAGTVPNNGLRPELIAPLEDTREMWSGHADVVVGIERTSDRWDDRLLSRARDALPTGRLEELDSTAMLAPRLRGQRESPGWTRFGDSLLRENPAARARGDDIGAYPLALAASESDRGSAWADKRLEASGLILFAPR